MKNAIIYITFIIVLTTKTLSCLNWEEKLQPIENTVFENIDFPSYFTSASSSIQNFYDPFTDLDSFRILNPPIYQITISIPYDNNFDYLNHCSALS
jgi:hypothetical protein